MKEKKSKAFIAYENNLKATPASTKNESSVIPTPCPLVYRRGNELTIEDGLDLTRKDELWGIKSGFGPFIELKFHRMNQQKAKSMANELVYNGKNGRLPKDEKVLSYKAYEQKADFNQTVAILQQNGIKAERQKGLMFCAVWGYNLSDCGSCNIERIDTYSRVRLGVVF